MLHTRSRGLLAAHLQAQQHSQPLAQLPPGHSPGRQAALKPCQARGLLLHQWLHSLLQHLQVPSLQGRSGRPPQQQQQQHLYHQLQTPLQVVRSSCRQSGSSEQRRRPAAVLHSSRLVLLQHHHLQPSACRPSVRGQQGPSPLQELKRLEPSGLHHLCRLEPQQQHSRQQQQVGHRLQASQA